jgi:nucleoside phosphorylase
MLLLAAVREELGDLPGEVVGIGPVVAAARAATILERRKPSAVALIGTAGAYPGGPAIGVAIVAQMVGLSPGVAAMGLGYVPRPPAPVPGDEGLLAKLSLPRHHVLTTGAVTTDLTLARRLADGWEVEHLEGFGVAVACQNAGIPFIAVLGISNLVGPEAHAQWLTHRDAAQEAARAAVLPLLELG